MVSGNAKVAGVVGYPVKHSLSPKLHNHWLAEYGIDGLYNPFEIAPEDFAEAVKAMPKLGIKGANVTLPYKEAALKLADEVDELARKVGAVNTLIFKDGKVIGRNTDVYGFIANIKSKAPNWQFKRKKAVMIGAGGAARAVCVGLQQEGIDEIIIVNRTRERAEEIKQHVGGNIRVEPWEKLDEAIVEAELLVNTSTLGMTGKEPLIIDLAKLPIDALVTDIVYTPLETELLKAAKVRGNIIVTGLGMLLHQAVPGFEAWFGKKPEVTDTLEHFMLGKESL